MTNLTIAAIVAVLAAEPNAAPEVARPAGAEAVFQCDFDEPWDRNYDLWPDGWERRRGLGYPAYVPCKITPEDPRPGRELRMELNGAGALAQSPPVPIDPAFSYVLQVRARTEAVQSGKALVSLEFRGRPEAKGEAKVVGYFESPSFRSDDWTTCMVGPVAPPEGAASAVIGLHLLPADTTELQGSASFADVWLGRLPRIELDTGSPHSVFTERERIQVRCRVSGLRTLESVDFRLEDVTGRTLAESRQPLRREVRAMMPVSLREQRGSEEFAPLAASWRPPISEPGFYRVRATVENRERGSHGRELTLVYTDRAAPPPQGEFGWVLSSLEDPVPSEALPSLLRQAGVNWIKAPAWHHEQRSERLEALARLAERLDRERIQVVAVLDQPPPELQPHLADAEHPVAADVFSTPVELWYPSLEPTLARLALKIHWWQLGNDDDASFVGYQAMAATLDRVRRALGRFGQHLNLGVSWRFLAAGPRAPAQELPQFVGLSAEPALTAEELTAYLPLAMPTGVQRWTTLDPLPAQDYALATRVADLVERMVAARQGGAEGIFIRRPFDDTRGLMRPDGSPGELLLPWRTAAQQLAGRKYLGSLTLPGGSRSEAFGGGGAAAVVVWRTEPGHESANLGSSAKQIDVWGRPLEIVPEAASGNQRFAVGPWPTFLIGVDEPLVRWQIGLRLDPPQLPSVVRRPQRVAMVIENPFDQGIVGRIRIHAPGQWSVLPEAFEFQLGPGESHSQPLDVRLPSDVTLGPHPMELDVQLSAGQRYEFQVHRALEVGTGDLRLEAFTRLNARGELEIEQHLVNSSDRPLGLECLLYAPDRKRLRSFVRVRDGEDVRIYRLPNGGELLGKPLWLRAEEQQGDRVFNIRFLAQ